MERTVILSLLMVCAAEFSFASTPVPSDKITPTSKGTNYPSTSKTTDYSENSKTGYPESLKPTSYSTSSESASFLSTSTTGTDTTHSKVSEDSTTGSEDTSTVETTTTERSSTTKTTAAKPTTTVKTTTAGFSSTTTIPTTTTTEWQKMDDEESDALSNFVVSEIQKLKIEHKELDGCQQLNLSSVLSGKKLSGKITKYTVTLKVQPQAKNTEECLQMNSTMTNMHPEICEADVTEGERGKSEKTLLRSTCLQVEELQD